MKALPQQKAVTFGQLYRARAELKWEDTKEREKAIATDEMDTMRYMRSVQTRVLFDTWPIQLGEEPANDTVEPADTAADNDRDAADETPDDSDQNSTATTSGSP